MRASIEHAGIELEVHYDYQPAEPANYNMESPYFGPGCPAEVDIYEIRHQGEDITGIVDEFALSRMEHQLLVSLEEYA